MKKDIQGIVSKNGQKEDEFRKFMLNKQYESPVNERYDMLSRYYENNCSEP